MVLCSTLVCFPQRLTRLIVLCILSCFMSSGSSSEFPSTSTLLSLQATICKHRNSCLSSSFRLSVTVVNRKGPGTPQHTSPVSFSAHACPGPLYHTSPQLSLTFPTTTIFAGMKPYCCPLMWTPPSWGFPPLFPFDSTEHHLAAHFSFSDIPFLHQILLKNQVRTWPL